MNVKIESGRRGPGTARLILALVSALVLAAGNQPAPAAPVAAVACDVDAEGTQRAANWIRGLATKLILPSDLSGRLRVQDPALAAMVAAGWSELQPLRDDPGRLDVATRWIRGRAGGLIIASDVNGRLRSQDALVAAVVTAAWSRLRCNG